MAVSGRTHPVNAASRWCPIKSQQFTSSSAAVMSACDNTGFANRSASDRADSATTWRHHTHTHTACGGERRPVTTSEASHHHTHTKRTRQMWPCSEASVAFIKSNAATAASPPVPAGMGNQRYHTLHPAANRRRRGVPGLPRTIRCEPGAAFGDEGVQHGDQVAVIWLEEREHLQQRRTDKARYRHQQYRV